MSRLFIAILLLFTATFGAAAQDLSAYEQEAEQVLQRLRAAMMAEMQKAMQVGAKEAISVCRHLAPEIEARIETETGWEIRRTSLKVRNPDNAPIGDEKGLLQSMDLKAMAGQSPSLLRTIRLTERNGEKTVQFMQATPTFDTCLACHGDTIDPAVMSEIKALYPNDEATGYAVGDIRGAFSLYKRYDPATQSAESSRSVEWERIAALQLPETVILSDGNTGNAATGRDSFVKSCKSCHSPGDLSRHYFGSDETGTEKQVCLILQTHGLTDETRDCDIVAFLKELARLQ